MIDCSGSKRLWMAARTKEGKKDSSVAVAGCNGQKGGTAAKADQIQNSLPQRANTKICITVDIRLNSGGKSLYVNSFPV